MVRKQWLYNNSMAKFSKIIGYHMVQKIGKKQKSYQGWEICGKDDILTVEERNNTPYRK